MAQYGSGMAFALASGETKVFEGLSNGTLRVYWSGTSTNLSMTFGGVTTVLATGAAAPGNHGEVEIDFKAGQQITLTAGASLVAVASSRQRLA